MAQTKQLENNIIIAQSFESEFALKGNYIIDKSKLEKKNSDTSELVKKTGYKAKIAKKEYKISIASSLVKKTNRL